MNLTTTYNDAEQITERLITRAYAMVANAERLIAEQREKIRMLETLSFSDPLTGLMNRRGFEAALLREMSAAGRSPDAAGVVVMIDLDDFKKINDTLGHAAGDAYLKAVAQFMSDNCRGADILGRMGGDEFAIIMPHMTSGAGQKRAAELLFKLNQTFTAWEGHTLQLQASYGAARYSGRTSKEMVMQIADARLYAQKALRKHRVENEQATA